MIRFRVCAVFGRQLLRGQGVRADALEFMTGGKGMALEFNAKDHLPGGDKRATPSTKKKKLHLIPGKGTQSFTIIVDTREQHPYTFADMVSRKLDHGDYSVAGLDGLVAVERKSMQDLHGSFTHGRARFERECKALSEYAYAALVIEGSYFEVLAPVKNSKASPESIVASVLSWSIKYGLHVYFVENRAGGEDLVYRLLNQAVRLWNKGELRGTKWQKTTGTNQ